MFSSSKNERVRVSKTSPVIVLTTNHGDKTSSKALLPPCSHFPTMAEEEVAAVVAESKSKSKRRSKRKGKRKRREKKKDKRETERERERDRERERKRERECTKLHNTPPQHTSTPHHSHHTTHQTTDRDLQSFFNVNAWICACQTTDRDLETKKVNAWTCAHPTPDHDLANAIFLFKTVTPVTPVMSVIFCGQECFRIIIKL